MCDITLLDVKKKTRKEKIDTPKMINSTHMISIKIENKRKEREREREIKPIGENHCLSSYTLR